MYKSHSMILSIGKLLFVILALEIYFSISNSTGISLVEWINGILDFLAAFKNAI